MMILMLIHYLEKHMFGRLNKRGQTDKGLHILGNHFRFSPTHFCYHFPFHMTKSQLADF